MPKTIKSITLKKDYTFTIEELKPSFFQDGLENATVQDILESATLADLIRMKPEAFVIENEKETPKFPNGAEVFAPKIGTKYFYSYNDAEGVSQTTWNDDIDDILYLRNQLVFLEKEKCESSTVLKDRHLEITQKIYQINAENDWVADWSDQKQSKYFVLWDHPNSHGYYGVLDEGKMQSGGEVYYCEQAQRYVKTLSVEDQKAFLLIYT